MAQMRSAKLSLLELVIREAGGSSDLGLAKPGLVAVSEEA
jgi:hypothetical protein